MSIDIENNQGSLTAHATNTLTGTLVMKGKDEQGEIWQLDNVSSTLVGFLDEESSKNENLLFGILSGLQRLKFENNYEDLIVKSKEKTLQFKRFLPEKKPYETSDLLS